MTYTAFARLAVVFITGTLLAVAETSHADIITINPGSNNYDGYANINPGVTAWQSFTVTGGNLTTVALWLLQFGNQFPTGNVDLFVGEGLGGTKLTTVTGTTTQQIGGSFSGLYFYVADFGGLPLAAGQYTISFRDVPIPLRPAVNFSDTYSGGKYVYNNFTVGDLLFYTSSPTGQGSYNSGGGGGGVSAVPEPGSVMLMGSGLLGMLGFRRRELLAYFKR